MKKIAAFAGSTSSTSINKQLVAFTANSLSNTQFDILDLREYLAPIFSEDEEKKGFPTSIQKFNDLLDNYDGFILSLAEHNGSYTAAFKNIFDWTSRINRKVFRDKPVLLMAASPGGRGGSSVLTAANASFLHLGAKTIITFSLPDFYDNFKEMNLTNETLKKAHQKAVIAFEKSL